MQEVAEGLAHLHSRQPPMLHGALKPSRVLLTADMTARLGPPAFAAGDPATTQVLCG